MMRIKELRETQDLSQQELAARMGVTRNAVTNWEAEMALPKARDLPLLAHVLGCTITELYDPDYLAQYTQPDDLAG